MSNHDIAIQQASAVANTAIIKGPTYLVTLNNGSKADSYFLARTFAEGPTYSKFQGCHVQAGMTEEKAVTDFNQILTATPTSKFVEVSYPTWRVKGIQSLSFVAKDSIKQR